MSYNALRWLLLALGMFVWLSTHTGPLLGAELDALRLFHEPSGSPFTPPQVLEREETWVQSAAPIPDDKVRDVIVFKYHGFISSALGIQYLINGVPLIELEALELLSVNEGGRLLELKTPSGQMFQLRKGQSIERASL